MNPELKCPPVVTALICALLIWLSGRWWPLPDAWLEPVQWLGYGLVAAALLLGVVALVQFRRKRTTFHPHRPGDSSALVVTGVYRYSRNPMYMGLLMLLTAWAIYTPSLLAPVWLVLFVLYMNRYQIIPEERALEALFGDEYRAYKARVRRWI